MTLVEINLQIKAKVRDKTKVFLADSGLVDHRLPKVKIQSDYVILSVRHYISNSFGIRECIAAFSKWAGSRLNKPPPLGT